MTSETVTARTRFETALVGEHSFGNCETEEPALIINPAAKPAALVAAAAARAQALSDGLSACMMGTTNASREEQLRAFDHLADELELLLSELGTMLANRPYADLAAVREVANG